MKKLLTPLGIMAQAGLCLTQLNAQQDKVNILFIAVDDLKPVLGCYGDNLVKTPNIDRIAAQGTVFLNNYCQQAVSGPTRASLMTGMRPDYTRVWDLRTRMRDINPDILSLPQYLVSQGYTTQGIGKVYDQRCVDQDLDKPSWSVPYHAAEDNFYPPDHGRPVFGRYQLQETRELAEKYLEEAHEKGLKGAEANNYALGFIKPSVECADVPDNAYNDGANALKAREILIDLEQSDHPFFFAVGFSKPHLPFAAPKKYWGLYTRDEMPLARFKQKAADSPEFAYHNSGELRSYTDIPPLVHTSFQSTGLGLPEEKQKELIHGYYAAISYIDAQIGMLLNTLDSLDLTKNTVIVLWGDHGWHLGDHDLWCKHSNFEQATRAPLLISAPWIKPGKTRSMSEFLDIFPTLCELAQIPIPEHLDGKSLVPVMRNPAASVKEFAVSQYPRNFSLENAPSENLLGYDTGKLMGYSIRTERYRYTLWLDNNYRSYQPYEPGLVVARELYDYENDPAETVNLADNEEYKKIRGEMDKAMTGFLKAQEEKYRRLAEEEKARQTATKQPDYLLFDKHTENAILLNQLGDQSEEMQLLYRKAYEVLSSDPRACYIDLAGNDEVQKLCREYNVLLFGGPMPGNVTEKGATVWVRTTSPASVEIRVKLGKKERSFGPVRSTRESDLAVIVPVTGLKPGRRYECRVLVDGKPVQLQQDFFISTLPSKRNADGMRIAFGSCFHRWGLGNMALSEQIRKRGPAALLLNGDIAVQDRNNHLGMHRADYLMRDFFTPWQDITATVPVYATWDDHDYFDDDKAGIPDGFTLADKEGVWKVFTQSWNNPSYGSGKEKKGVFFRTRIGPCDIIMTDTRYFRSGEKGSFLGDEQMEWLKDQLLDCKGPFIILSSGTMWSDYVSAGKDSWGVYDPEGRERIFSLIEKHKIAGVLLISGDRHGARVFRIPRPSGFSFYEFEAASLGGRAGPPPTNPDWDTQMFGISGKYAFGEFEFNTSVPDPEVTFRLTGDDGTVLYESKLNRSLLTPG